MRLHIDQFTPEKYTLTFHENIVPFYSEPVTLYVEMSQYLDRREELTGFNDITGNLMGVPFHGMLVEAKKTKTLKLGGESEELEMSYYLSFQ
jgi:hypothetical protein